MRQYQKHREDFVANCELYGVARPQNTETMSDPTSDISEKHGTIISIKAEIFEICNTNRRKYTVYYS